MAYCCDSTVIITVFLQQGIAKDVINLAVGQDIAREEEKNIFQ
jgi:hypothetical protein